MVNELEPKKILVTGGAGFIGANLVRMLLRSGYKVVVLDNLSTGNKEALEGLPIRFVLGDILERERVDEALVGCDGVVHLAAQSTVPASLLDPEMDCRINVLGTLNLLEAAKKASEARNEGLRFVFASSNAPLGRQPPPATEEKAPLPISPYGASKLAGEGYCHAYHGSWGLGTVILRFANVYGPFSAHSEGVIPKFFRSFLAGREITIDGDGMQTRDFVYVGDLCRAIVMALESSIGGETFQIATGQETSILELVRTMESVLGKGFRKRHGPIRLGDIRKNYSCVSKIEKMLGWQPLVDLVSGLRETSLYYEL